MSTAITDQNGKPQTQGEKIRKIDYKMVSFTLAGKDYGVDIMRVKEIRKAGNFTKVPNTPVYVKGVDNLRGDIIPIIDLRIMFNLPAETRAVGELENIIILRVDELIIGVIVDSIEKVIGISSDSIQPPHPIFGDINVKYISGVVENDNRLYIILDVDRIFGIPDEPQAPKEMVFQETVPEVSSEKIKSQGTGQASLDLVFISETLGTFANFHVTSLNQDYVGRRIESWKKERSGEGQDYQLNNKEDANSFLRDFYSPFTARLWPLDYLKSLFEALEFDGPLVSIWNPGCGTGFESYSLAMGMELVHPGKAYKIWANDYDLLNISMAPSLTLGEGQTPDEFRKYTVESKNGLQFTTEIKGKVLFEFHDINHMNPFQDLHMIVARDLLSFLRPVDQEKVLGEFSEKLRSGGYLVLGKNESIVNNGEWTLIETPDWKIYRK